MLTVEQLIERLQDMPPGWTVDARVPDGLDQDGHPDRYVVDLFETPMRPSGPTDGWVTLLLGDPS